MERYTMTHYVALKRIQFRGADGKGRTVLPREGKQTGIFDDLPEGQFDRLQELGAIRLARREEVVAAGLDEKPVEPSVEEPPVEDERTKLEQEAERLGVKFRKNVSDDVLRERIAEANRGEDDPRDILGD